MILSFTLSLLPVIPFGRALIGFMKKHAIENYVIHALCKQANWYIFLNKYCECTALPNIRLKPHFSISRVLAYST